MWDLSCFSIGDSVLKDPVWRQFLNADVSPMMSLKALQAVADQQRCMSTGDIVLKNGFPAAASNVGL